MIVKGRQVERFLRQPDPTVRAVLVYGPDAGLVRERAEALLRGVVADPADPFRIAHLSADLLRQDPARLADEAAAIAMTGGRRVVRITEAGDGVTAVFKAFLDQPAGDALVLVEAGDLPKRARLRLLFEAAANAAALPCYADDAGALDALIRAALAAEGLTVSEEALAWLQAHLGADRLLTRRELEKLVLYKANDADRQVSLADAEAAVGDAAERTLDDIVFAAASGDAAALDRALVAGFAAGVTPVAMLRALGGHLQRLHLVLARVAQGTSRQQAIRALKPPVFFKRMDVFEAQLARWDLARLDTMLAFVVAAERDCKRTGMPAEAICGQTLLRVAAAAGGSSGMR